MLYAISIMYKMRLPLILVFNKNDVEKETKVFEWINDFDKLDNALRQQSEYISSFSQSLSLILIEFYKTIKYVSVSSKTGDGFDKLLDICDELKKNYNNEKDGSS